ncbi:hypothetical protein [Sediminispirochaeta smaragdinae]|jgi:hypothetical protein|uniref:Uncharacterized protein n=1 Tax=Sediminispirochaeta smaragdinae (strain DSM 11293 / JCM 15392 / SEBR 4228) TaxID=573413 RepID=E1R3A0_SEDSS|nr:hypothetical protein [Sediminispirochaeta smaragdinae]ADK81531.1 conserved hypothetical protein [Sediminispirochaeta smaragdinae DSM 11293]
MAPKALDLFQAYSQDKLPREGGYIVSSFFEGRTAYSIYEVVAYSGVKSIYLTEEGLTFQTDGNKLFVLVEPATYPQKFVEPFRRDTKHQIPQRFNELEIYTAKNQTKVMVSKEPIISYGSFTIMKPSGINFSLLFYANDEVMDTLGYFFTETLNREAGIPKSDARQAHKSILEGIKKFGIW